MIIWTSVPDKLPQGRVVRREVSNTKQLPSAMFSDIFDYAKSFPSHTVTCVIEDGNGRVLGLGAHGPDETVLKLTPDIADIVSKGEYSEFQPELASFAQRMLDVLETDAEITSRYGS